MTYSPKSLLLLAKSRALEGERRSTYWCMPATLFLCFLLLFLILLFFSFFLFFSQCLLLCCDSLLEVTITVIVIPILCMARVLYIMLAVTGFYYFSL